MKETTRLTNRNFRHERDHEREKLCGRSSGVRKMDFKEIVRNAQQLISKHFLYSQVKHAVSQTEADMLRQFFEANLVPQEQRTFLTQILHGCVRNYKLIAETLELFYQKSGTRILKSKYNFYACI